MKLIADNRTVRSGLTITPDRAYQSAVAQCMPMKESVRVIGAEADASKKYLKPLKAIPGASFMA